MDQRLWRILENINRWLEYAEKKNAVLLSFIGLQLTVGNILVKCPNKLQIAASSLLGICFLLSLFSFFPKTFIPEWIEHWANSTSSPKDDDNLLFYGHIANYAVAKYIERLEEYFEESIAENRYLKDICTQIVMNSQIAKNKYSMFKTATWFMVVGQVCFLISFWG